MKSKLFLYQFGDPGNVHWMNISKDCCTLFFELKEPVENLYKLHYFGIKEFKCNSLNTAGSITFAHPPALCEALGLRFSGKLLNTLKEDGSR